MFETVLLCTVFGVFILLAYTLGLKNGQKLKNDEKIELPNITKPIGTIKEFKNDELNVLTKEQQLEWDNINNFNGSIDSQKPID